ncbi:bifunctional riboflavin kinase/FAD synthetase [Lactococcus termiticola]|uniref:Riboflavin biosynthesis protein n=1 Tax=Lactococcus termiticola TaxID=2169526 RepID=A0A2R5HGG0_9LACT|nr:bifunctional riboflavin kinase/FAD synthetase [Lactococcus termiticola]GBG97104.1 riboflavin biosynthesis protein RibF [Lactococcus termiticola]
MQIFNYDNITSLPEKTVLVLGYFDGLHRGHQALFEEARKVATVLNLKIAVLTFPEKPTLTFQKFEAEMLLKLTSDVQRERLFEENGVDYLVYKDFTSKFAHQNSSEFLSAIRPKFKPEVIVTGFDYTTGSDMVNLHSTEDLKVINVSEVKDREGKISSSRIREAIQAGNVALANELLGYKYEITGLVVHGFARGRELGYPTANLVIKDFIHLPAAGVYTVDIKEEGTWRRGFASIGYNETFGGKEKTIEVHIFDFSEEIYGESLTVRWLDKIRDMQKFDGIDGLVAQMKRDEEKARNYLAAE